MLSRGAGAALQLLLNLVVVRFLGPAEAGEYYLYTSWLQVGGAASELGYPVLTLRTTAALGAGGRLRDAQPTWLKGLRTTSVVTGVAALVMVLGRDAFADTLLGNHALALVIAFVGLSLMPQVFLRINVETLKGQGRPKAGLNLQYTLIPSVIIVIVVAVRALAGRLAVVDVFIAYAVTLLLASLVAGVAVRSGFQAAPHRDDPVEGRYDAPGERTALRHFWVATLMTQGIANAPFIVLPYVTDTVHIGLFGVANRLATVATLTLVAIASIYTPLLAGAYAERKAEDLRSLLRRTQVACLVVYVPVFFVLIFGGGWALRLFGAPFVHARGILTILAAGQLGNAAVGLSSWFNLVTDNERFEMRNRATAVFALLILGYVAGERWGAAGVAMCVAIVLAGKNLASLLKSQQTIRRLRAPIVGPGPTVA